MLGGVKGSWQPPGSLEQLINNYHAGKARFGDRDRVFGLIYLSTSSNNNSSRRRSNLPENTFDLAEARCYHRSGFFIAG